MLTREEKNKKYRHTSLEMETSTHFPILMKIVNQTEGPIIEVGSGMFSTPLLHWMCFENKRSLTTIERHAHYYDFAKKFKSVNHLVQHVPSIENSSFVYVGKYSIVFIDHSPKKPRTRGDDALLFKDIADYIIVHDCGPDPKEKYGYQQLFSQFKFVYHYVKTGAHTTVLSNFRNLSWLEN